jgi:hypothetical protein
MSAPQIDDLLDQPGTLPEQHAIGERANVSFLDSHLSLTAKGKQRVRRRCMRQATGVKRQSVTIDILSSIPHDLPGAPATCAHPYRLNMAQAHFFSRRFLAATLRLGNEHGQRIS